MTVIPYPPPKRPTIPLPDEGPWRLLVFKGRVLAFSQESGLYLVEAATLRKIDVEDGPHVDRPG